MSSTDAPPIKPRSRRKDARPGEILDAALNVFAERGFAATRLDAVAAAAGVGKGTIYLYFSSKEDLFRAVVRQRLLPNLEEIERTLAADTGSAADQIRLIVGRLARLADSRLAVLPKLVLAESGNFPALARFYADEVMNRGAKMLCGVIRRGIERGEFRPVDPLAVLPLIGGPLMMLALWRHILAPYTEFRLDPEAVTATHLDVLLRGLAAEGAR
jgi:AcrR family transcriptional regulator